MPPTSTLFCNRTT